MLKTTLQLIAVVSFLSNSAQARADILDRINDCEDRNGANGCVYDLLREVARSGSNQPDQIVSYCECRYANRTCEGRASASFLTLTIENVTQGTLTNRQLGCFPGSSGPGSGQSECDAALRSHPRCK